LWFCEKSGANFVEDEHAVTDGDDGGDAVNQQKNKLTMGTDRALPTHEHLVKAEPLCFVAPRHRT
jgi:hypothetical protein